MTDTWMPLKVAAATLGSSRDYTLLLVLRGEIDGWKTNDPGRKGGRWRVSRASVEDYVQRRVAACQEVV